MVGAMKHCLMLMLLVYSTNAEHQDVMRRYMHYVGMQVENGMYMLGQMEAAASSGPHSGSAGAAYSADLRALLRDMWETGINLIQRYEDSSPQGRRQEYDPNAIGQTDSLRNITSCPKCDCPKRRQKKPTDVKENLVDEEKQKKRRERRERRKREKAAEDQQKREKAAEDQRRREKGAEERERKKNIRDEKKRRRDLAKKTKQDIRERNRKGKEANRVKRDVQCPWPPCEPTKTRKTVAICPWPPCHDPDQDREDHEKREKAAEDQHNREKATDKRVKITLVYGFMQVISDFIGLK